MPNLDKKNPYIAVDIMIKQREKLEGIYDENKISQFIFIGCYYID